DRGPDVDLVVVLEPLRPHVAPPLNVFRLPVLERALQALVAREVDVIRDLLGGNHDASQSRTQRRTEATKAAQLTNLCDLCHLCVLCGRTWVFIQVRLQSNSGRPCSPYAFSAPF